MAYFDPTKDSSYTGSKHKGGGATKGTATGFIGSKYVGDQFRENSLALKPGTSQKDYNFSKYGTTGDAKTDTAYTNAYGAHGAKAPATQPDPTSGSGGAAPAGGGGGANGGGGAGGGGGAIASPAPGGSMAGLQAAIGAPAAPPDAINGGISSPLRRDLGYRQPPSLAALLNGRVY